MIPQLSGTRSPGTSFAIEEEGVWGGECGVVA